MEIKALTLWQPWASLVIGGWKRWETRSYKTRYRGELAIHAAKREPDWCRVLWDNELCFSCLIGMGYQTFDQLPRGAVLGYVRLQDIWPTHRMQYQVGRMEQEFGDFRTGRFAWKLEDPVKFDRPHKIRGRQGLWNYTLDVSPIYLARERKEQ